MKSARRIVLAITLLFFARPASATIGYHISLKNPEQHLFHVEMQIPVAAAEQEIIVAIPAWYSLYQVRDFSYRVRDVRASNSAAPATALPVRLLDKQTWKILLPVAGAGAGSAVQTATLDYSIEWDDPGPFNSQLNAHHAFVNFAEVLMYVPTRRAEDTQVQFDDVPDGWRIAAELPAGSPPNSFTAASYDTLVDAPTEAGKFNEFAFDDAGTHFRVIVDGKEWHRESLESIVRDITKYEVHLMGGAPFHDYTFFYHFGPYAEVGGGGMEHSNCTAISVPSGDAAASVPKLLSRWITPRKCTRARCGSQKESPAPTAPTLSNAAASGPRINFTRTSRDKSANWIRAPRTSGRASKNPASTPGSKATTNTAAPSAASPITTKARSSETCWTSRFAMPPTITNRSTTSCAACTKSMRSKAAFTTIRKACKQPPKKSPVQTLTISSAAT